LTNRCKMVHSVSIWGWKTTIRIVMFSPVALADHPRNIPAKLDSILYFSTFQWCNVFNFSAHVHLTMYMYYFNFKNKIHFMYINIL
jgi:hypothetical protein